MIRTSFNFHIFIHQIGLIKDKSSRSADHFLLCCSSQTFKICKIGQWDSRVFHTWYFILFTIYQFFCVTHFIYWSIWPNWVSNYACWIRVIYLPGCHKSFDIFIFFCYSFFLFIAILIYENKLNQVYIPAVIFFVLTNGVKRHRLSILIYSPLIKLPK